MTVSGRISAGAESAAYTFRYLRADGAFLRVSQARCSGDAEAIRLATAERCDYAAVEISCDGRLVWYGLREDAIAAAAA